MRPIFTVDPHTGVPIYLQLMEQVKRAVALGVLAPGERLPTVKQLASELTVNPNTVARAIRELEREGVIETSQGRGSFVRGDHAVDAAAQGLSGAAASSLDAAVREAKSMGLSRETVHELFDQALERWYPNDHTEEQAL